MPIVTGTPSRARLHCVPCTPPLPSGPTGSLEHAANSAAIVSAPSRVRALRGRMLRLNEDARVVWRRAVHSAQLADGVGEEHPIELAEACGHRVAEVDFLHGVIRPMVQFPADELKSEASRSPVPIPRSMALELAEQVRLYSQHCCQALTAGNCRRGRLSARCGRLGRRSPGCRTDSARYLWPPVARPRGVEARGCRGGISGPAGTGAEQDG